VALEAGRPLAMYVLNKIKKRKSHHHVKKKLNRLLPAQQAGEGRSVFGKKTRVFCKRSSKLFFAKLFFGGFPSNRKMMGKKNEERKVNVVVTIDISSKQVLKFARGSA